VQSCAPRSRVATVLLSAIASAALGIEPAADLKIKTLNGDAFSLESLAGHVVVLDFWASWCMPCRTSFPSLGALQGKHELKGLRVLGLTLEDTGDAFREFLDDAPAFFTVLRDPSGTPAT
jgi:cytochrome c biogenesis protein CcmG/thiol:disulfide interchange protein DsbE